MGGLEDERQDQQQNSKYNRVVGDQRVHSQSTCLGWGSRVVARYRITAAGLTEYLLPGNGTGRKTITGRLQQASPEDEVHSSGSE